jgi:hypothetical protein
MNRKEIDYPYVAKLTSSMVNPGGVVEPEKPTTETAEESKTGTITKVSVVGPPERNKKRNIIVNTNHCRAEIDTIQYVVNKYGYREANNA